MRRARLCLRSLVIALGLCLTLAPGVVQAQAASSEAAVEARRNQAKRHFQSGAELYRQGQYRPAVEAFLEADRLAPSPALSFNIAKAYERLEDTSGALRWYRDYLRRSPSAKNAAEVQARINELSVQLSRTGVQQLTVLSMPVGATVLIDGRAVGVTPFTGDLLPGKHQVILDLAGYRDARSEIVLTPQAPRELSVSLEAEPKETAAAIASSLPLPGIDRGERRFGVLPWVVAGAGVASLGGALGFELARRSEEESARKADQRAFQASLEDMERHQTVARVLAGVGGALVITGGVLLLVNDSKPSAPRVGLGCTLRGCTASARGSF